MREVRAGANAGSMEVHCLQAYSPRLAQLAFFIQQDHLPRGNAAEVGWALPLPSQVMSRECCTDLPQADLMEAVFPGDSRLCEADRSRHKA